MAQERQNIYIGAPGFKGLNTADSPVTQDPAFASIAENAVIDKFGRVAARKGLKKLTSSATPLGSSIGIETIFEYVKRDGTKIVFSAGNNKIFTGTTTLTEVTLPGGYSITANNWKIVSFNNDIYFFQRGHAALVSVAGSTTLVAVEDGGHAAPAGNEVLAAFGRLFVADVANNSYTLFFSDLLNGDNFHGGSSGSLDVTTVFPEGFDEIVALKEFNDFLVIFCKRSILLYSGASSPSSMTLSDTITGIGCIARDSVQSIGTDLIFLSNSGVRSLGRIIQEKSNPIGNVSKNVKDTLMESVNSEALNIKSVYSAEESFYLLFLPTSLEVYVFDTRGYLEDGSYRATQWIGNKILCGAVLQDNTLYLGSIKGINEYDNFDDDGESYIFKYFTNPLSFGDPSRLKMLKELSFTVIGGSGAVVVGNWAYDYTESYSKQTATLATSLIAEYGVSEYNVSTSEYSASIIIDIAKLKATGSGKVATIGLEATINGGALSLQELNTEAIIGRLV
tara:strand:+ start:1787 stop:3307 length:1521 start_codon:yes stop_codon:yes gene_type:complete